jgi:glucose/arabinose dehydrogenase
VRAARVALSVALVLAAAAPAPAAPAGLRRAPAGPFGRAATLPPSAPPGFVVTVAGVSPTATSLAFSPDGRALYVANALGSVLRYPVVAGLLAGPPTTFLRGLSTPLGVVATRDAVFVSSQRPGRTRVEGIVQRARDRDGDGRADLVQTVIAGLPNGRHNTNGMALCPDGMLYITNGNSTDSGFDEEGGPPEVRPYSGSVLRVDPAATNLRPSPEMVVATGFRNIYDIAFLPGTTVAAVPMNGPDGLRYGDVQRPAGEDTLNLFDVADHAVRHFGFPWCLYDRARGGLAGFTQDPRQGQCDPLPAEASAGLPAPVVRARPAALFGLHVSADGLAVNPGTAIPRAAAFDLFVAEFGSFFGTTPAGHKVVRVRIDRDGRVRSVEDFLTGVLPLDLAFAPDGALWVADFSGALLRVAPALRRR